MDAWRRLREFVGERPCSPRRGSVTSAGRPALDRAAGWTQPRLDVIGLDELLLMLEPGTARRPRRSRSSYC